MIESKQQFVWIDNGKMSSSPIGASVIPLGIGTRRKNDMRTLFVISGDGGDKQPRGIHFTDEGRRAYIATCEGFIERSVLAMRDEVIDGALIGDLRKLDARGCFPLGLLRDPKRRAVLSEGIRHRDRQLFNSLWRLPYNAIVSPESKADDYKTIFTPMLGFGSWSEQSVCDMTRDAMPTLGHIIPRISTEGLKETTNVGTSLFVGYRQVTARTTPQDSVDLWHSDITRFIEERLETRYHLYIDDFSESGFNQTPFYSVYLARLSLMRLESDNGGFQPLALTLNIMSPYSTIVRESAFHWAAMNNFLNHYATHGCQGFTNSYYFEPLAERRLRLKFKNRYAERNVTLLASWSDERQEFDVAYSNDKATWGSPRNEEYAKAYYYESHGNDRSGELVGTKGFNFDQGLYDEELLNRFGTITNLDDDHAVFHVRGQSLMNLINNHWECDSDINIGGELSYGHYFAACTCDGLTDEYDGLGLDSYPCNRAVADGYVGDATLAAFGKGYLFDQFEYYDRPMGYDPVANPMNSDFVELSITDNSRKENIEAAIGELSQKLATDGATNKVVSLFANRLRNPRITDAATIINWMNGFEFYGESDVSRSAVEGFYKDILTAQIEKQRWSASYPWFDVYLYRVNGGYQFGLHVKGIDDPQATEYKDTAEYKSHEHEIALRKLTYHVIASLDIGFTPNVSRSGEYESWMYFYYIPCFLLYHKWNWKAITPPQE